MEYYDYQVDTFTDISNALLSFKEKKHDLVLLGLNSRKIDYITIYRKLKKEYDSLTILIITPDYNLADYIKEKIPEIKNNFVYEPITLRELKKEIDAMTSRSNNNN
ncbi:MAG: response regulator [Nitrososphaeraceae archaeon]|nr:response regulator [Nitrososphaeraceae archaeon]